MPFRRLIVVSIAVVAALAAVAAVAASRLPPGTTLPVHWNAAGEANRFAGAAVALFMPVVLAAGLSALFAVLPRIEPLQDRLNGSAALLGTTWVAMLALLALVEAAVAAPAFGLTPPPRLPLAGLGVFLVAIGNALPKSRPGFFIGIRTPWTLIDTDNWIATHRLGARTMVAGGAVVVVAAVVPLGGAAREGLITLALAGAVVPPVVYSYWRWQRGAGQRTSV